MSKLFIASAAAVAIAGLAWIHQKHAAAQVEAAVGAERARLSDVAREKLVAANKRAMDAESAAAIQDLENRIELHDLTERARADAGRAADELGRLRASLTVYRGRGGPAGAGAGAVQGADEASTLADALDQCSERYAGVAAVADELSIQVTGLQRYVTEVAGPICIAGMSADAAP